MERRLSSLYDQKPGADSGGSFSAAPHTISLELRHRPAPISPPRRAADSGGSLRPPLEHSHSGAPSSGAATPVFFNRPALTTSAAPAAAATAPPARTAFDAAHSHPGNPAPRSSTAPARIDAPCFPPSEMPARSQHAARARAAAVAPGAHPEAQPAAGGTQSMQSARSTHSSAAVVTERAGEALVATDEGYGTALGSMRDSSSGNEDTAAAGGTKELPLMREPKRAQPVRAIPSHACVRML